MRWRPSSRTGTALAAVGVIVGMVGLTAAAVPLYELFCRATGYGGTTSVAERAPDEVVDRTMTVRFDANVAPDLPWRFAAPEPVEVRLGETAVVAYTAANLGDEPVLGTATYNVTPFKAGAYFSKIECFCFTEQLLMPGERKEFPVSLFVDPAIAEDPNAREVTTITLSYTFFDQGREARDRYLREHEVAARRGGEAAE